MKHNLLALATTILLTGCGGGGESTSTTTSNTIANTSANNSLTGVAVDGYLQDASVCIDINNNGICDGSDIRGTTNQQGAFTLMIGTWTNQDVSGKSIIVSGGTDINNPTAPFTGTLRSVVDTSLTSQIVTPLTTLVQAKVAAGVPLTTARQEVAFSLGLNANDLTQDPITLYNTNPNVYARGVALQHEMEKNQSLENTLVSQLNGINTYAQVQDFLGSSTQQSLTEIENETLNFGPVLPSTTNTTTSNSQQINTSTGRLLASNCFQCHDTNGTGGFHAINGEANDVYGYQNRSANTDIMAAHAQGYSTAQLSALIGYLNQVR